jgi:hypothetical protein
MKTDLEAQARADFGADQGRKGDWMQTSRGTMFWPLDPRASEVHVEDIAHALSMLCRYGGHCKHFYSVGQHSVYVSRVLAAWGHDPLTCMIGLLHDATEAYCVDVPRPIKRYLAGYNQIEARIWLAVAEHFSLPAEMPECIHLADNAVLLAEKAQIMLPSPAPWSVPGEPADIEIIRLHPDAVRRIFMARYDELVQQIAEAA